MSEAPSASSPSPVILPIAHVFELGTRLLGVSLSDLSDEDAKARQRPGGSSISFIAGHLITGRHRILDMAGAPSETDRWQEQFGGGKSATDGEGYPTVGELLAAWNELAPKFRQALGSLSEDRLLAPMTGHPFPTTEDTLRGILTFLAFHEAYHVGQVGLLRTHFGYPSIRERATAPPAG